MSDYVRSLPHNEEAEKAILGAILMNYNDCIASVDLIKPEFFYKSKHETIFRAIQDMHINAKPIDMVSVIEELQKMKMLEKVGGAYYVTELCENSISSANIRQHIDIIKSNYTLRKFIIFAENMKARAFAKEDPEKLREDFTKSLIDSYESNTKIINKDAIVLERKKGLIERINGNIIATGFPSIDKFLSVGFSPKKSSIITALPRMGKTAFKENCTVNQCRRGLSVLHITPEMGFDSEMDRLTSIISGIKLIDIIKMKDWAVVKDGKIVAPTNNEKLKKVINATEEIESWNIHFLDGIITQSKIRQAIAETKLKHGLDIVYVDLFDRIAEVRGETKNKAQKITQVLGYLQNLEQEFDVHICNLVQIRRSAEQRKDKKPLLSDLKESGSFEEESWTIFGIYREAIYDKDAIDDTMEIIIMKQRQGPCESVELMFDKDTLKLSCKGEDDF